jgi:4-amino-4-deoxy-L-arabinose transferase-like glycosyltransferase
VLCASVLLFPGLGAAPLERAEIYFLDGARGMVERADWLVPYYRGEPFFDKPPLTYWLMASSFRAFGFSAGAARLVPAFATLGVLLATLWLGCVLFDRRTAATGTLVLATTGAFVGFGHVAMSDMLLALFSTLAVAIGARAVAGGAHAAWPVALSAALGLGFLTKGPIALLLPGLGLLWLTVRHRAALPRPRVLAAVAGAAVFAILAGGWFVLVHRRLGWGPLEHFFLRENLQRFAASTYDAQLPFWFYVPTYLAEGAPWSLFFPLAAWHAWRREGTSGRFLIGWFALMLVPLSLSRGKIDYYLLPFYPAASLVVARLFVHAPWEARERRWSRVVLVLAAVALVGLPLVVGTMPAGWVPGPVVRAVWTAALLAASAACVFAAMRADARRTLATLAASAALVVATLGGLVVPAFHRAQPQSAIVEDVARELRFRGDATVVACGDPARVQRDLLFQVRVVLQERCDLWALASSRRPFLLLLGPNERRSLLGAEGVREIGRYPFLPATALSLEGVVTRERPSEMTLAANFGTDDPVAEGKRRRDRKRALREDGAPE